MGATEEQQLRTGVEAEARASLRAVLGRFATGVAVVTTFDAGGAPVGITANSFSSVSLEPPLVSWCLNSDSYSLAAFKKSQCFAVSILAESQRDLALRFATPSAAKWQDIAYERATNGCPAFPGAIAILECDLVDQHEAGDHVIFLGAVRRHATFQPTEPLLFYRGQYHRLRQRLTKA